jgi:S1-C subfamily serine protease
MMINADMIGRMRSNRLEVYGVRTSPGLRQLVSRQNDGPALQLEFTWDIRPDSDHHSFYARNLPFLMLHTGKHPDYHRPSDDPERINVEGLTQTSQLLFGIVDELAETPKLGGFRSAARSESDAVRQNRERALPPVPGRLGVRWDEKAEKEGQIVVNAVTPNSAADKAGVKAGDRFVTFAGQQVGDAPTFRRLVLAAQNPVSATLARTGAGEPVAVTLNLAGSPVRLGLSWQTDDAEPAAVIVNRVIPGSAADQAGVRVGERIYRAAGQDVVDGDVLRRVAAEAQGSLALEVESSGRVRTVEVPLVDVPKPSAESAGQ